MIAAQHCMTSALRLLLRDQPLSEGKVALAWSAAVGHNVDRVTRVSLDQNGILAVYAENRNWAREVGRSAPLIVTRLNQLLGSATVTRIKVTPHYQR